MRNTPPPVKLITGHVVTKTVMGYVISWRSQTGKFEGRTDAHPVFQDAVKDFRKRCDAAGYMAGL